jgi:hypothetical protein
MIGGLGGISRERREGDLSKSCGGSPAPLALRRRGPTDPKETKTLRPLPILLALGAAGSFAAVIDPGSNTATCVRRGVVLAAVAIYAWMIV